MTVGCCNLWVGHGSGIWFSAPVTHAPEDRDGAEGWSLLECPVSVTWQTWEPLSHRGRTCGDEATIERRLVAFPVGVL